MVNLVSHGPRVTLTLRTIAIGCEFARESIQSSRMNIFDVGHIVSAETWAKLLLMHVGSVIPPDELNQCTLFNCSSIVEWLRNSSDFTQQNESDLWSTIRQLSNYRVLRLIYSGNWKLFSTHLLTAIMTLTSQPVSTGSLNERFSDQVLDLFSGIVSRMEPTWLLNTGALPVRDVGNVNDPVDRDNLMVTTDTRFTSVRIVNGNPIPVRILRQESGRLVTLGYLDPSDSVKLEVLLGSRLFARQLHNDDPVGEIKVESENSEWVIQNEDRDQPATNLEEDNEDVFGDTGMYWWDPSDPKRVAWSSCPLDENMGMALLAIKKVDRLFIHMWALHTTGSVMVRKIGWMLTIEETERMGNFVEVQFE